MRDEKEIVNRLISDMNIRASRKQIAFIVSELVKPERKGVSDIAEESRVYSSGRTGSKMSQAQVSAIKRQMESYGVICGEPAEPRSRGFESGFTWGKFSMMPFQNIDDVKMLKKITIGAR